MGVRVDVPIVLDAVSTFGFINVSVGHRHANVVFLGSTLTMTDTNTSSLHYLSLGGSVKSTFSNSSIANIAGRVWNLVAAGNNPNARFEINTNINSG